MDNKMAKLSKQDIQFIDNYLKNSGVILVDVRLEMVDHIASDIERKLEKNEEENFYDAFKAYMVKGKKALISDYEKERAKLNSKVIMKTLKAFLGKDVLLVGILFCLLVFKFKEFFLENFEYSLLLLIPAFSLYLILFKGAIKTSIATGLILVLIMPLFLGMYFKNPYIFLYVVGVLCLFGYLNKKLNIEVHTRKHKVVGVIFWFIIYFPILFYTKGFKELNKTSDEIAILVYYAFQLTHWYVVFKQIFKYKKELDTKYKMLLGV